MKEAFGWHSLSCSLSYFMGVHRLLPCSAGKLYLYRESISNVRARSNTLVFFSYAKKAKNVS